MNSTDNLKLSTNVTIQVKDAASGRLLHEQKIHNLFTLAGRNLIRDVLNCIPINGITHFAVGTGADTTKETDNTLYSEIYRDVVTKRTPYDPSLEIQQYLASTAANGYDLCEAGLFNSLNGGTMFARVTFQPITKTANVTVTFTWTINISAI